MIGPRSSRFRLLAASGLAFAVVPLGGIGAAPVITGALDVNANVGYSTNPFLQSGDDLDSGLAELTLAPSFRLTEATGEGSIGGFYRRAQYFRRYSESEDYGANANAYLRVSPLLQLTGSMRYDSSILGARNYLTAIDPVAPITPDPLDPSIPITPAPIFDPTVPIPGDIGLIGLRQRRTNYGGALGATMTPSARDTWTASLNADRTTYPGQGFGVNFKSYGGSFGYSRVMNERLNLGLSGSVFKIDYPGIEGDTTVYQPQVTFGYRINELWSFNGAVGAAFNDRKTISGNETTTSLSGNASLCRQSTRGSLCADVSRNTTANGLSGVQQATNASIRYSTLLSERTTASLQAGYTRVSSGRGFPSQDYLNTNASISRQLTERISVNATARYGDSSAIAGSSTSDLSVLAGVNVRLGARR